MAKRWSGGWPDGMDIMPLPGRSGNLGRAGDRHSRVRKQALALIAERIAMFGKDWRIGCAIKIPKDFKDPYEGQR